MLFLENNYLNCLSISMFTEFATYIPKYKKQKSFLDKLLNL